MARTDNLTNFLTDIANSIRSKKNTSDPIFASEFDTEIENLSGSTNYKPQYISFINFKGTDLDYEISNLDMSKITTLYECFKNCYNLKNIDLSNQDLSNVTNMQNMFRECKAIESIDLSNINNINTTNMASMFEKCEKLKNINLTNFCTSKVTLLNYMFLGCYSIEALDLSSFDTSKVINFQSIFYNCKKLVLLDVSNFDTSLVKNTSNMFGNCSSLSKLIIDNPNVFPMTNINMFQDSAIENGTGYIYVPDNLVETYKNATNWSTYASQIKGMSELETESV